MKNHLFNLFCVLSAAFFMGGCSMDAAQVLQHPDRARPGDVITVDILNSFVHITGGSNLMSEVIRDSLHAGIGLPEGWSVESVQMYAAPHFRPLAELDGMPADSLQNMDSLPSSITDSLAVFATRMTPMAADPAMAGFFIGKEFDLTVEETDSSFTLYADSVSSWNTFSAPVNLRLPAGSRADMVVPNEDTTIQVDSIGYVMIPVFIRAQIRVGSVETVENLYYYTKTGPLPAEPDTETTIDVDQGSITFYTITVSNSVCTRRIIPVPGLKMTVIRREPSLWRIDLSLDSPLSGPGRLGIYTFGGRLVRDLPFSPGPQQRSYTFQWDGTDSYGRTLDPGIYILNLRSCGRSVSQKLALNR